MSRPKIGTTRGWLPRLRSVALLIGLTSGAQSALAIDLLISVRDPEGQPLPGVTTTLRGLTDDREVLSATTDPKGLAHIRSIPAASYLLHASLDGFFPSVIPPFLVATDAPSEQLHLDLILNPIDPLQRGLLVLPEQWAPDPNIELEPMSNDQRLALYEAVLRHQIEGYDHSPRQFDDPLGREYCPILDARLRERGTAVPPSLLNALEDEFRVHPPDWCDHQIGRFVSVGPVVISTTRGVLLWSSSWLESRLGGFECLQLATRTSDGWSIEPSCFGGGAFD